MRISKKCCIFALVFYKINYMNISIGTFIWAPQSAFQIHGNTHYVVEDIEPDKEETVSNTPSAIPPDFFCISARFSEENIRERLDAELNLATSKIDYCRALYRLDHIGCINIRQFASDAKRANVFNRFQSKFNLAPNDFCRARMNI